MKLLTVILVIILIVAIVFISMQLGWNIRKREELIRQIGQVFIPGTVEADSKYFYVKLHQSDGFIEHLRIPRKDSHFDAVEGKTYTVEVVIRKWK